MGDRQVVDLSGPLLLLSQVQLRVGDLKGKVVVLVGLPKIDINQARYGYKLPVLRFPLYLPKRHPATPQGPQVDLGWGDRLDPCVCTGRQITCEHVFSPSPRGTRALGSCGRALPSLSLLSLPLRVEGNGHPSRPSSR